MSFPVLLTLNNTSKTVFRPVVLTFLPLLLPYTLLVI